jgi:two-component system, sensor histidine kinase and response regulator
MSKILVIEDEDAIRELITDILENEGYEVIAAADGPQGITLVEQFVPDLILCDIMMPNSSGYDVLSQVRQLPATEATPFVFLTAKASRSDQRHGMEMGADDYLSKPFTRVELLNAITARLEKKATVRNHYQRKIEELRQNMARAMPHELLTPLNGLIGLADILKYEHDAIEPDSLAEIAEGIGSSARRLHRVINNTLLYAKLRVLASDRTGSQDFRLHILQQPDFVAQYAAKDIIDKYTRQDDLSIQMDNCAIGVSEANLQKMIEELVDNACKFSPRHTPISIIGMVDGDRYHITVSDRGRGISPAQIQAIGAFQQFERQLYEQQGSGLGLVIVEQLVQLYGGELTIHSDAQQGTHIHLYLPLVTEEMLANLLDM